MTNFLIVEDNYKEFTIVEKILYGYDNNICVLHAKNINTAKKIISIVNIDLFILDVELPDGSGIDFAKELRKIDEYKSTWIIFTTVFADLVSQALGTMFIDYIVKPFKAERLIKSLDVVYGLSKKDEEHPKIRIRTKTVDYIVKPKDIIYVEARNNNLHIITRYGVHVINRLTLKSLLKMLPEKDFIQCYRSIIVNKNYVIKIYNSKNSTEIGLSETNIKIPVGGKYRTKFIEGLKKK